MAEIKYPDGLDFNLIPNRIERNTAQPDKIRMTFEDLLYIIDEIEKKVGINDSNDPLSLDYRLKLVENLNQLSSLMLSNLIENRLLYADNNKQITSSGFSAIDELNQIIYISQTLNQIAAGLISLDKIIIARQETFGLSLICSSDFTAATKAILKGVRSRGTLGSPSAVSSGDYLFSILAAGFDGTDAEATTEIAFECDGSVSNNVVPGRIVFRTSTTSGGMRTERLVIKSDGKIGIGLSGTAPSARLHIKEPIDTGYPEIFRLETDVNIGGSTITPCERTFQAAGITTDSTATTIWQIAKTNSTAYLYDIYIVAICTSGAEIGYGAAYHLVCSYKVDSAGNMSLIGLTRTDHEDDSAWSSSFGDDGSSNMRLRVQGVASNTIHWNATIKMFTVQ